MTMILPTASHCASAKKPLAVIIRSSLLFLFLILVVVLIPSSSASSASFAYAESIPHAPDTPDHACSSSQEGDSDGGDSCTTAPATPPLSSVYVIGDLHGDIQCAISWVNRTGLVANLLDTSSPPSSSSRLRPPSTWTWTDPHSTLLFLGDYVDKGPTSKQTLQFVRDLTLAFPQRVTALLGNHELELLRDRDGRVAPEERYGSYSYASVHPGEYHNYFQESRGAGGADDGEETVEQTKSDETSDEDNDRTTPTIHTETNPSRSLDSNDHLVLNLLYEASMEVYSYGAHNAVRFVPSLPPPPPPSSHHNNQRNQHGVLYAITDIIPPQHRTLVKERLQEYQNAYFHTYRSGSTLGNWLETRPIVHLAEEIHTLFVHGGVHPTVGKLHLHNGKESVDAMNRIWWEHSTEEKLYDFLGSSPYGQVVYSLLTYRGNHPGYSKWETHGHADDDATDTEAVCTELKTMLNGMRDVDRIGVGHTPDFHVRLYCGEMFLALDSMLGRGIRATGNEYCPWPGHDLGGIPKVSRNGKYRCDDVPETCHGETVRIDSDGTVNVITL